MKSAKSVEQIYGPPFRAAPAWYNLALPFSERRLLLFIGDIIAAFLAAWLAFFVWQRFYPDSALAPAFVREQIQWLSLLGFAWFTLLGVNEGYDLRIAVRLPQILKIVLSTDLILAFLYLLAFFVWGRIPWRVFFQTQALPNTILPRITPSVFLLAAPLTTFLWRLIYARLFTSGLLRRRAIIVGSGRAGRALVQDIQLEAADFDIVGFVDDDPAKQRQLIEGIPVLGTRTDLVRLVQQMKVSEVVLAITHGTHTELFQALIDCNEHGVDVRPMPVVYEEMLERIPVEHLGQKWFLVPLWRGAGLPTVYRLFKRLMDISLSLIGLAFFAVTLPFIALIMYLDSPGPIFYNQERIGKGGKRFKIYKLRSMIPNAEKGGKAVWATKDDPRITRVGKIMRRIRLDEFPQLWNVFKGDMSIIGPRPERPQFVEQLQQDIPFYRVRHSVKPGLTGWAQIKYRYGNTVDDSLIKLQYDLYYIKRQSISLDILIMLRTIKVMLAFKGT